MIRPAAFPYALGPGGQTATTDVATFLEQLIVQIVFVEPGERVNRPDFGCSLRSLVFSQGSGGVNAAVESLAQSALRQWVGDAVRIHDVDVVRDDTMVTVTVRYVDVATQSARQLVVTR